MKPSLILDRHHGDAVLAGGRAEHVLLLGEHREGRGHVLFEHEVAVARIAARDLQVDQTFGHVVARGDLAMKRQQCGVIGRHRDADGLGRALQPRGMAVIIEQLAVQNAGDLVNRIGKDIAAIEDRDLGLFLGQPFSVEIDDTAHRALLRFRDMKMS
jgi:hypothetical protein